MDSSAYDDLLRDTRGLRREHAQAREAWLAKLPIPGKEGWLFELEILLKGLACFSNPRNHPGAARKTPVVAQDFREQLVVAREALARALALSRTLAGEGERAFVFQRYLESVLPDDTARARLVRGSGEQESPDDSLFVLRLGLTHLHEIASAMSRLERVPFRVFYATLALLQREVGQSSYFNPLSALEFRPEFDRVTHPELLNLMRAVPSDAARRLVALVFLALFRMLRYLDLLEASAAREEANDAAVAGVVYPILAVLRSDARALTTHLRAHAGPELALGFEQAIFRVNAAHIGERFGPLTSEARQLLELRSTLETLSAHLRLEMRRLFERSFPAPELAPSRTEVRVAAKELASDLRATLQNAAVFVGLALGVRLDERGVFADAASKRALSERLRRDVWMFAQIVRAFAEKGRTVAPQPDAWADGSSLAFVRDFIAYFRAMGFPLLRAADYPRVDAFTDALAKLEEDDLVDRTKLAAAVDEAERFHAFLAHLVEQIGQRGELQGVPFDRRAAAEALRRYLRERA